MAFFAPSLGIGVKQRCIKVEFSLGHLNMIKLRGALAEDLIVHHLLRFLSCRGRAVSCETHRAANGFSFRLNAT